ncbi:hypothetical protein K7W42_07675 [Deinococcus sp. HMF7604]|uniref:hypothetical protein n=1 Tax=Deinococcus betulae TaxID=2873312 RepID=UPI001CCC33E6|nr:hypothetical protein [Deinococcus betulae]MBZ9750738.1 hypothetical protein [Deinococcus betulae]
MQDTTTKPRALTRTWEAVVTYRECSVVTGHQTFVVTLTRVAGVIEATINGAAAAVRDALNILRGALVTKLDEVLEPAPIGKPQAANLHRRMGRAGLRNAEHYELASAALERPVHSFAGLTAQEAATVLGFFTDAFPDMAAVALVAA